MTAATLKPQRAGASFMLSSTPTTTQGKSAANAAPTQVSWRRRRFMLTWASGRKQWIWRMRSERRCRTSGRIDCQGMDHMKATLAIVAGYAVWTIIWLSGNFVLRTVGVLPKDTSARIDSAGALSTLIGISIVCSLAAGGSPRSYRETPQNIRR